MSRSAADGYVLTGKAETAAWGLALEPGYSNQMMDASFEVERRFGSPEDDPIRLSAVAVLEDHFARHPLDVQVSSRGVERKADLTELLTDQARQDYLQRSLDRSLNEVRRGPSGLGVGIAQSGAWMILVSVPLTAFLTSFLSEAGKDAYLTLKTLLGKLFAIFPRESTRRRKVHLRDPGSGLVIELHDRLPERAYQELVGLAVPRLPSRYAPARLRWEDQWVLTVQAEAPEDYRNELPWYPVDLAWKAEEHRWVFSQQA
jgi:hypothetical protein